VGLEVGLLLDDYTITKSKGNLFRFMRHGADYYAVHVHRNTRIRVFISISLTLEFMPELIGEGRGIVGKLNVLPIVSAFYGPQPSSKFPPRSSISCRYRRRNPRPH